MRRVDPLEHAVDREVDVVQRSELRVVERVEADGDAAQAGIGERLRLLGQQRAVRRQRQLDVERGELLDSRSRSRRTSGSPPVIRIFRTPASANTRATRVISSNVRSSRRSRKR